jgi:hypothetical protein
MNSHCWSDSWIAGFRPGWLEPVIVLQAPLLQPGAAGAVPDHIMRMQLQTLQMQAMSLGVGGGLPGAMPGTSAPLVVRTGQHSAASDGAGSGASTVQTVIC